VAERPEDFLLQALEVGWNQSDRPIDRELLWHLQQEVKVHWRIHVYDSSLHMASALKKGTPDILITHWHGGYHEDRRLPLTLVRRLRKRRGDKIGQGPFLVGHVTDPLEFVPQQVRVLLQVFDMLFRRTSNVEYVVRDVAIGLWNSLKRENNPALPDIPFQSLDAVMPSTGGTFAEQRQDMVRASPKTRTLSP
jgi:hypothetical protein